MTNKHPCCHKGTFTDANDVQERENANENQSSHLEGQLTPQALRVDARIRR